jgi:hypothetical protein
MTAGERPSWTDRDEQLHAGFRDVACRYCGVTVLVRKMIPKQTSVQWTTDASACPYLSPDSAGTPGEGCPELRGSVHAAVDAGLLPPEPVAVTPEEPAWPTPAIGR